MKTRLATALFLAATCSLPAMAEDTTSSNDANAEKIKALEAELAALRAQLQATSQVRGEDRARTRGPVHDRDIQIDIQGDFETGMEQIPEFAREMIMERMAGRGEPMSIMVNGREMVVGDMPHHRGPRGDHRGEHRSSHQVMQFDLSDMTDGGMEGEVHIEIMGDRDMAHLAEAIPHLIMTGMMEDGRWDDEHDMEHGDDIGEELMRRMEHHGLPLGLVEEVMEQHEIHNEHDVIIGMDMLIERIESEGHDAEPIMALRDEFIGRLEGHHGDRHHEDPYLQQGSEFVEKMFLSEEIANVLSDQRAVSIFCIWEARQHLQPEERLQALFPIMTNGEVDMAVRNAAAMVVRQSFYELGDRPKAIETLRNQILSNEGLLD